jgi:hypothetical protein
MVLEQLAASFAQRRLAMNVAAVHGLSEAARALSEVVSGGRRAVW